MSGPLASFTSSTAAPSLRSLMAMAALVAVSGAWAAQPGTKADIESAYQRDRAACMASDSQHERTSCLREAGAVRAEALRGAAKDTESEAVRARNALQRCQGLPDARRDVCERMARGEGSASGSVEGGGVIRELTIMEPVPSGAAPADALPPSAR